MTLRRYGRREDVNATTLKEVPRVYSLSGIQRIEAVSTTAGIKLCARPCGTVAALILPLSCWLI